MSEANLCAYCSKVSFRMDFHLQVAEILCCHVEPHGTDDGPEVPEPSPSGNKRKKNTLYEIRRFELAVEDGLHEVPKPLRSKVS